MKPASRYLLTLSILMLFASPAMALTTQRVQYNLSTLTPQCTQEDALQHLRDNKCAAINEAGGFCDPDDPNTEPGPVYLGFHEADVLESMPPGYENEDWSMYYGYYVIEAGGTDGPRVGVFYSKTAYADQTLVCNGGPQDPDQDSDGLPDDQDPFPNDDRPFTWKVKADCMDTNGNIKGQVVEVDNGDGTKTMNVGDVSNCDKFWVVLGDDEKDYDDWWAMFDGTEYGLEGQDGTPYRGDDSPGYQDWYDGKPETPAEGIASGEGSDPADTDSNLLEKIVNNTKKQTDNEQVLADKLKSLNQKASEQIERSQEQTGQLDDIKDELQKLNDDTDATISDDGTNIIQSEFDTAATEFATPMEVPEEYQNKNDLDTEVGSRIGASGVLDMITGVGIQASGSCSMETTIYGRQIALTVCNYADELQAWGVILMAITSLSSILVVFKR